MLHWNKLDRILIAGVAIVAVLGSDACCGIVLELMCVVLTKVRLRIRVLS